MRKVFVALACVAFVASMTSCKKDCKCSGTYKIDMYGFSQEITVPEFSVGEMSKKDCENYEYSAGIAGATYSLTCKSE